MTFAPLKSGQVESLSSRLAAFAQEIQHDRLLDLAERLGDLTMRERDRLSTELMAVFATERNNEAFAILYELNQEGVLRLVYHHLRRSFFNVDAQDVLQEVFFNIYRYPKNFDSTKPSAFRNWTHSIARNTALKHSRRAQRNHVVSLAGQPDQGQDEMPSLEPEDINGRTPLEETQAREAQEELVGAWMLYLHFYQEAYRCLTPQEKRALFLVEVDGKPYKEAAAELGMRVENLKMRIFRARRKIFTIMKRKFTLGEAHILRTAAQEVQASRADAGRVAQAIEDRRASRIPAVETPPVDAAGGRFTSIKRRGAKR
ncbi:MAG: RNA polymerase sigma factor [Planctomycetota bacterium]